MRIEDTANDGLVGCDAVHIKSNSQEMTASTAMTEPRTQEVKKQQSTTAYDFEWHTDRPPGPQTQELCVKLSSLNKLYRQPDGKVVLLNVGCPPKVIRDAVAFEGVIRSNFRVVVYRKGKIAGNAIPSKDLSVLLRCDTLQNELRVVDKVCSTATYNNEWKLTTSNYNEGPDGDRTFYTGSHVTPRKSPTLIRKILDILSFKTESDRTNLLALALTILLRFRWPGGKPFGQIVGNKSHCGKTTAAMFAAGCTKSVFVSWQDKDWPVQNELVAGFADPDVGVAVLDNIRSGGSIIESAFIERTVTSPDSLMQSSKQRDAYRRGGDFVILCTANTGKFSPDLMNRSIPVYLEFFGDVSKRVSPVGDIREFLETNKVEIHAELCGLVEEWKIQGRPLDETVKHPMRSWCSTVGGMLKANGFNGFLENWSVQRNVNDSIREALSIIAANSVPNGWLRVDSVLSTAIEQGVVGTLMSSKHRESHASMLRQIGVVLTAHRDELLTLETDEGTKSFTLVKDRNSSLGQLATVYRFEKEELPQP